MMSASLEEHGRVVKPSITTSQPLNHMVLLLSLIVLLKGLNPHSADG